MPELDDDFAKDVDEEVETLVELKAKVREELENNKKAAHERFKTKQSKRLLKMQRSVKFQQL